MFKYREIDYHRDIPDVVNLIKAGLDASYNEEFFIWKHLENPFGKSYGLLALDGKKIVGLRMFMFWEFFNSGNNKVLKAIRPVDTVVDPEYRGNGLFKKMTMKGLEGCSRSFDLIFNTPNENSLPGYVKMGWKQKNTRYFKLGIILPSFSKINLGFGEIPENIPPTDNGWQTLKNRNYFLWRFQDKHYKKVIYKGAFIVYSIAKTKTQKQIVIEEAIGDRTSLKKIIRELSRVEKTLISYYYSSCDHMDEFFVINFKRKKSVLAFRNDSNQVGEKILFSLGDLEGRL